MRGLATFALTFLLQLLVASLFLGTAVYAQTLPATSPPSGESVASKNDPVYLICKNKKQVRTLRVSKKSNGGCASTYTKEGVDQVVGNSWAVERCSKIIMNIKENLEKADWKCKDISEARVSSSDSL